MTTYLYPSSFPCTTGIQTPESSNKASMHRLLVSLLSKYYLTAAWQESAFRTPSLEAAKEEGTYIYYFSSNGSLALFAPPGLFPSTLNARSIPTSPALLPCSASSFIAPRCGVELKLHFIASSAVYLIHCSIRIVPITRAASGYE